MIGLGMDLCRIDRIQRAMKEQERFLSRYYTEEERAYLAGRGRGAAESAAAMFAAKEALLKAMGVGLGGGVALQEIGVVHDEHGAPRYALTGAAEARLRALGAVRMHLTLTHEDGTAAAVAVIE